jgi:hypothetical protein
VASFEHGVERHAGEPHESEGDREPWASPPSGSATLAGKPAGDEQATPDRKQVSPPRQICLMEDLGGR